MESLLEEAERILTSNIPCQLDPITKEILTISILGVILVKGQVAINKLPNALKSLQVISDHRSIINIMHEELGNYQEDELVLNADASMTRTIEYKDNKFQEQRTMIISLKASDISYINLVALAMHELFHLLRFGGI